MTKIQLREILKELQKVRYTKKFKGANMFYNDILIEEIDMENLRLCLFVTPENLSNAYHSVTYDINNRVYIGYESLDDVEPIEFKDGFEVTLNPFNVDKIEFN